MDTEPKTEGIYPINPAYIATHGLGKITTPAEFRAVIRQVVLAVDATITDADIQQDLVMISRTTTLIRM